LKTSKAVCLILFSLVLPSFSYALGLTDSSIVISIDPPFTEGTNVIQYLKVKTENPVNADVRIQSFLMNENDSILIYDLEFNNVEINRGFNNLELNLTRNDKLHGMNYSFFETFKKFDIIPPGKYRTYCTLRNHDSVWIAEQFHWYFDSTLSRNSLLRKDINSIFHDSKNKLKESSKRQYISSKPNAAQAERLSNKINRSVGKKSGVITVNEQRGDKTFSALYYKDWFLGFYEILPAPLLKEKITKEKMQLLNDPSSFITNDLESFTSISSQTKRLNKKKSENELTGNIELTANFSTGQEPASKYENNYQELYANLNTDILKIPVIVEGYYTTQDNNRQGKSSYIRVKYDVEKNKAELNQVLQSYKNKYNETCAKAKGIDIIYERLLNELNEQKNSLQSSFLKEYSIDSMLLNAYNGDVNVLLSKIDTNMLSDVNASTRSYKTKRDSIHKKIEANKSKIDQQYKKLKGIQENISKYSTLLEQYRKQQYFDSALVYGKINKLLDQANTTSDKLAKAAENLLPAGEVSSFLNKLTRLELGILNNYESRYTMSGQTLVGGGMGYNLGLVTVSAATGKTEYISREGTIDKYNSTMLRVDVLPTDKREFGVIYYTYSPSRQIIQDNKFIQSDISVPSFQKPTQILSIPFRASITSNLSITGEGATSFKKYENSTKIGKENTALNTSVIYYIPKVETSLQAEWEHVGKLFDNDVIPFPKASTERLTLAGKKDLLRSSVTVGIQFNHLKQETFSSSGRNIKWGFDIRTHSKRYPNIYLSYKPFTTFRKFDDTLSIAQRPLIGSVWIAQSSYQFKRIKCHHRFLFSYNRNSSSMDTDVYKNITVQAGYILTQKTNVMNVNVGWTRQPQFFSTTELSSTNYFTNASVSKNLKDDISINLGQDISHANFGIQRIATTIGAMYVLKRKPISIRLNVRYANFKQSEVAEEERIWSSQVGLNWLIKPANTNKKKYH